MSNDKTDEQIKKWDTRVLQNEIGVEIESDALLGSRDLQVTIKGGAECSAELDATGTVRSRQASRSITQLEDQLQASCV